MQIKNYTTTVPADRSIIEIEKILAQFGATHIMKTYDKERVYGIAFRIDGQGYQIPTNLNGIEKIMFKGNATQKQWEQVYRVAWRLIKDWIYAQLSIIACGQAEIKEVFLPYMWDGKQTLYQAYKDGNLKLEHKEDEIR